MPRFVLAAVAMLSVFAVPAFGQAPVPVDNRQPAEKSWSFFASAYTYIIPDASNYVQPSFSADRDWLHLEARYNYESRKTGSAWLGANFSGGSTVEWEVTPIFGVVFGELDGVAPGYKGSITWRKLSLYSESEYVIDTGSSSDSFLYNWSELTYAITDSLRAGLVVQRTRIYQTDRDVQRGVIVGYSYKRAEFTLAIFNPDEDKPTSAFSVGIRF